MKKFVLLFLLSFNFSLSAYQYEVSIFAIFQNEAPYLKEWLDYHAAIGVDHFYLYNHNSTDNCLEILTPYMEDGTVEYVDFSQDGYPQNEAIMNCLEKVKCQTKWLGIIDIDEFFFPKKHNNLKDFLKGYEQYGAVTVNWQCFGTSDVEEIKPGEYQLEKLTWKSDPYFGWNGHVKCFVRPERVASVINTHVFTYIENYIAVRPNELPHGGSHDAPIQLDIIVLNHYWTRDKKFFYEEKIPRCMRIKGWTFKQTEEIDHLYLNSVEDREIWDRFGEKLVNYRLSHSSL